MDKDDVITGNGIEMQRLKQAEWVNLAIARFDLAKFYNEIGDLDKCREQLGWLKDILDAKQESLND